MHQANLRFAIVEMLRLCRLYLTCTAEPYFLVRRTNRDEWRNAERRAHMKRNMEIVQIFRRYFYVAHMQAANCYQV